MALALAGCASTRPPWVNAPVERLPAASAYRLASALAVEDDREALTVVLAFSGGGTRAAAFAAGVLEELAATRLHWRGLDISLADEVDLVSGVSGGSVAAAYFVAFGAGRLPAFRSDFLYQDIETQLLQRTLRPDWLWRLSSPWMGVSHVLAAHLDKLYGGLRYGDLMQVQGQAHEQARPLLLITATDLDSGSEFAFTQDQFDRLCSDLREVPLSFAVAASSAVPLLLTPLALRNHRDVCHGGGVAPAPFLHLVDGGLADNLGLRHLLAHAETEADQPSRVQQVILINVDAARDPKHGVNRSERVPGLWQVLEAMAYNATEGRNRETRRWLDRTLAALPDREMLHVVSVTLNDFDDAAERHWLRRVPTSLSLPRSDVDRIVDAGRRGLRDHPDFQRALQSLRDAPQPGGTAAAVP